MAYKTYWRIAWPYMLLTLFLLIPLAILVPPVRPYLLPVGLLAEAGVLLLVVSVVRQVRRPLRRLKEASERLAAGENPVH